MRRSNGDEGVRPVVTVGGLAPETGGPAVTVPALCGALARGGLQVELLSLDMGDTYSLPQAKPPECLHLTMVSSFVWPRARIKWAPGFGRAVARLCSEAGTVVLHDNGAWLPGNHAVARVARKLGIPLVLSPHGTLLPWAVRHKRGKKRLAWWLYQRHDLDAVAAFHAASEEEAQGLVSLGLRQPVAVIPYGVEVPVVPPRQKHEGDSRVVLFLARLSHGKGLDTLLSAWANLRPEGWHLVVAGPDEDGTGRRARALVRDVGIAETVEFVGPVWGPRKWELLNAADFLVLPSVSESFGMVVAEALGCGVPVIATKAVPWQALELEDCGWWIEAGEESLRKALLQATSTADAARRAMGERGRRFVAARYRWSTAAERFVELYRWILGSGDRPGSVVHGELQRRRVSPVSAPQ